MRVLCLDVGEERIGVAVSDEKGLLARPLEVIHRRSSRRISRQYPDWSKNGT